MATTSTVVKPKKPRSEKQKAVFEKLKANRKPFEKQRTKESGGLLTPRQTYVLRLTCLGCSAAEAALIMSISPSTADNHKRAVMEILGVTKSVLLVHKALKLGVIKPGEKLTPKEKATLGSDWSDGWN